MKRKYYLPIGSLGFEPSNLCKEVGGAHQYERTTEDVRRATVRAASGRYAYLVFPENILVHPLREQFFNLTSKSAISTVVQIDLHHLNAAKLETIQKLIQRGFLVTCLFREWEPQWNKTVQSWEEHRNLLDLVCVPKHDKRKAWLAHFKYIPERLLSKVSFLFRTQNFNGQLALVNSCVLSLKNRYPKVKVSTPEGLDVWEDRAASGLSMEPMDEPSLTRQVAQSGDLKISVVIPCYNNRDYLLNVLEHLLQQDLPLAHFEIIVIDDGSSDGTQSAMTDWLSSRTENFNFSYIYSPRPLDRKMGDGMYRAGIARNLGAKYARGEYLCFLDSDILTPTYYLSQLLLEHAQFDVIQTQRLNLNMKSSGRLVKYDEVNSVKNFFSAEGGYWEVFYKTQNWMSFYMFWKYTCTYGLSLRRDLFFKAGWFRKTFIFYGFEDSELGYRLFKCGAKFHLSSLKVLHLCHKDDRSEFKNNDFARQSLLTKTAEILYLNTLDPEIFEHFKHMYNQSPVFLRRMRLWGWLFLNRLRA